MKYFDDHMLVLADNHQTPCGNKVKGLIDKYQLQEYQIVLTRTNSGRKVLALFTHKLFVFHHWQKVWLPVIAKP
ncbi:MAG: hypothetical protein IPI90_15780 [Saprospiraceae bacterium]|nr:hypothetical protein [Candidatus Vicinibacter affinis]